MSGSIPPSSPPTLPSTPQPPTPAPLTINGNSYSVKVFVGDTQQSLTKSKIEQLRTAILDAINNLEKKEKKSTLDAKKFTILCSDSANASLQAENEEHSYTISATKAKGIWNAVHGTRTPSPDALKASDDGGSVTEDSDIDSVDFNNLDIEKLPLPKEIELEGYTFIYGEKTPETPEKALLFTHQGKEYYVEVDKEFPSSLQTHLQAELATERANLDLQICTAIEHLFFYEKQCDVPLDNPDSLRGIVGMNKGRMPRSVNVRCELVNKDAPTPADAHSIEYEGCTYAITIYGIKPDAIKDRVDQIIREKTIKKIDGSVPVGIVNLIGRALRNGDGSYTESNSSLPPVLEELPQPKRSGSVTSITSRPASPTGSVRSLSSVTLPDGFSVTEKRYEDARRFFATDKNGNDNDNQTIYFVKSQRENGGFKRILDLNGLSQTDSFLCCELPVADSTHTKTEGMLDRNQAFSLSQMLSVHQHTLHSADDFKHALCAAYAIVRDAPDMELDPEACASEFIKKMAEFELMSQEEEDKGDAFSTTLHSQLSDHIEKPIQRSSFERIRNYCGNDPDKVTALLEQYNASSPISVVNKVRVHYDFSGKVVATPTDDSLLVDVALNPLQRIDDVHAGLEALRKARKTYPIVDISAHITRDVQPAIAEAKRKRRAKEAAAKAAQEAAQSASQEAPKKPRWDAF